MQTRNAILILLFFSSICVVSQDLDRIYSPTSFFTPDTVCVGQKFKIDNKITGSTYYWSFCTANANNAPSGINLGNPGNNLTDPQFITIIKDSTECFSFIADPGNQTVIRNYHGKSFRNSPVSSYKITAPPFSGVIKGIQVKKDQGDWYGFVANGSSMTRLFFGASLMNNNPSFITIPLNGVNSAMGLVIVKQGNDWIGFTVDDQSNNLTRFSFGASLSNTNPTIDNLGNIGFLSAPGSLALTIDNNKWYMLINNQGDNTISRLSFGNSLLLTPTGENLGNVGGLEQNTGITLLHDCNYYHGFVINNQTDQNNLVQLNFPSGITGPVYGMPLPNVGNLNRSYGISEIMRSGDTIYSFSTNEGSSSLTRLYLPGCNASIPSSFQGPNPDSIEYTIPGNFNNILMVAYFFVHPKILIQHILLLYHRMIHNTANQSYQHTYQFHL